MSEREDVEALDEVFDRLSVPSWIRPAFTDWLATHDEQVRAEALAPVRVLVDEWEARERDVEGTRRGCIADVRTALQIEVFPAGEKRRR